MIEILRHRHFGRLDVGTVIALTEKTGQFFLGFSLRAAERHVFRDPPSR